MIAAVDSTAARLHFGAVHKVVRILKKRAREMSCSSKVSRTFEFLCVFGAAEKSQGAAEKNKEKVEANCTGFSAEFFGSQSVEMFCFARKTKIQMLTTSCPSLTRIHQQFLKSLGLYYHDKNQRQGLKKSHA